MRNKIFPTLRRFVYINLYLIDQLLGRKTMLAIVSYHSVSDDDWLYGIRFDTLQKQIAYLAKQYTFVEMSDVALYLNGKKQLKKPSVVITFDDGYEDVYQTKDFFAKNKIKPTIFVLADTAKANKKELATERPFLNNMQLKTIAKNGWSIGSHSSTHADFAALTAKKLDDEVVLAKRSLEKEFGLIRYFAYPKGKYSNKVVQKVKDAGYTLAVSMDGGVIDQSTNPFTLPRVGVDRSHSLFEFQTLFSPSVMQVRGLLLSLLKKSL